METNEHLDIDWEARDYAYQAQQSALEEEFYQIKQQEL